jgi:hypothetical protein
MALLFVVWLFKTVKSTRTAMRAILAIVFMASPLSRGDA